MKHALHVALLGGPVVILTSCGGLTSSNSQTFDPAIDPLDSPGNRQEAPEETVDAGPKFAPGSYVEVSDSNAGFYRRHPRGHEQPDHRLATGTPLKVVGTQGSYVKVETESGQIGFVPAIMVSSRSSGTGPRTPAGPLAPAPPPSIDPIDPLPEPLPPTPLPAPSDPPFVAPEPEIPPISVEESPTPTPSTPVIPLEPSDGESNP